MQARSASSSTIKSWMREDLLLIDLALSSSTVRPEGWLTRLPGALWLGAGSEGGTGVSHLSILLLRGHVKPLLDFSNGFLIAEIFSWYYPEDIQMHCFENGTSLAVKLSNWSQLGKFFAKRNLKPIRELIDGTIHCKPGAAEVFVQDIYTMLTNRRIKHSRDEEIDFTDRIYQEKLPMVARSTASRAIKTNIKLTELMVEPNIDKNRQKVNAIINMHMHRRLLDREQDPGEWLFQNIVWKTELHLLPSKIAQSQRQSDTNGAGFFGYNINFCISDNHCLLSLEKPHREMQKWATEMQIYLHSCQYIYGTYVGQVYVPSLENKSY
uniref:Spermatogenesis associated 4 n=1 Tax=Varanus komodoensis TaxID=61221 RepID=A0A8D2Q2A6_VARKO